MYFIELLNHAWYIKRENGNEIAQEHFKNLLSYPYVRISECFGNKYFGNSATAFNIIFKAFETVIISIMKCDSDFSQGEYDAYIKFANYCNQKYYSADEIRNMSINNDQLVKAINVLKSYRFSISSEDYEGMVLAFCYLALLGDNAFDENEYYIIRCFLDDEYDICPSDWQSFKRTW